MANEDHLAILKQGVEAWNKWRQEDPNTRPDLREANLSGADLSGTDFRNADLCKADLHWANLRFADLGAAYLIWANLIGVDLSEANLSWAELHEANLSEADLYKADLHKADLSRAYLNEANLGGADLSEADLNEADFSGANLGGANLSGEDLRKADLSEASLIKADFSGANLSGVDFTRVNLHEADFSKADLSGSDLSGADLTGTFLIEADLSRANLREANIAGAKVGRTMFGDVDLSVIKGLEEVYHIGPSTVGIDTIYKSKGKIPKVFLRGCGVSDTMIAYVGALVGQPIQYYSCFVSYSSKDQECAERLHADLQSKGVRCWFAPKDLKIGDRFRTRIDEAIRYYDKLLLILSEHSVNSKWVEKEVETAFDKETPDRTVLFPLRLDDAVMKTDQAWAADIRRTRHIGDFCSWKDHDAYQKAFDRLLRDLQAESQEP